MIAPPKTAGKAVKRYLFLANHVECLKEDNKILRARTPGQIHTRTAEREQLLKLGKAIRRAIEELVMIVTLATFYRWVHDKKVAKPNPKNPKGGQRKPKELRELAIQIAQKQVNGQPCVNHRPRIRTTVIESHDVTKFSSYVCAAPPHSRRWRSSPRR